MPVDPAGEAGHIKSTQPPMRGISNTSPFVVHGTQECVCGNRRMSRQLHAADRARRIVCMRFQVVAYPPVCDVLLFGMALLANVAGRRAIPSSAIPLTWSTFTNGQERQPNVFSTSSFVLSATVSAASFPALICRASSVHPTSASPVTAVHATWPVDTENQRADHRAISATAGGRRVRRRVAAVVVIIFEVLPTALACVSSDSPSRDVVFLRHDGARSRRDRQRPRGRARAHTHIRLMFGGA